MSKTEEEIRKTHPVGTSCFIWISDPFMAFEGEVIELIKTKTDKYPWYRVKYYDTRFNSFYFEIAYELYLTIESAKEAHDIMKKIFLEA